MITLNDDKSDYIKQSNKAITLSDHIKRSF